VMPFRRSVLPAREPLSLQALLEGGPGYPSREQNGHILRRETTHRLRSEQGDQGCGHGAHHNSSPIFLSIHFKHAQLPRSAGLSNGSSVAIQTDSSALCKSGAAVHNAIAAHYVYISFL
jgi:hypothetical protein